MMGFSIAFIIIVLIVLYSLARTAGESDRILENIREQYHYDKDLRKLTLATDTPNKRLDGIVAEPPLVYDAKEKSR